MNYKEHKAYGKMRRILLCVLVFSSQFSILNFLTSCSGEYVGMPRAEVLDYQTHPTYGGLYALASSHAQSLNAAVKADTLHPGMYAEYGITLALMGHNGPACRMLNAEAKTFPESRQMVERIKQRLMPDMLADTLGRLRDTADLLQLASWAYDSLTALKPLPYIAPVIDSTDTAWISMQTPVDSVEIPVRLTANQKRELLAQEQAKEAMRQKEVEDSIAAAKQAVKDARKKEKADREKAKKEKEKAQKEARKAKEKAREEAKKEKERQREEERQRKAAEREAEKAAREAAKNEQKGGEQ